jgi:hypothetical protein
MEKKLLNKKSAVTLIELIAVVVLITLIFAASTVIVVIGMRLFKTELAKSTITDDLTIALEWIKKDAIQSDNVDTATANKITLDFSFPAPFQINYYVKSGTTELYRKKVGDTGDGKLITDMIDTGNLPVFSKPAGSNYLLAEIWISDPDAGSSVHQDMGVMLRCCGN